MRLIPLLLILSMSAFSKSEQEKFCESAQISHRLPSLAEKLLSIADHMIDSLHTGFDQEPSREKDVTLARAFKYTKVCENQEFLKDFDLEMKDLLQSEEYKADVIVKGTNPSLGCLEISRPESEWRELRLKQARVLCERVKGVSYFEQKTCRGKLGPVDLKYALEIRFSPYPKAQCLLVLKQIRDVIDRFRSK